MTSGTPTLSTYRVPSRDLAYVGLLVAAVGWGAAFIAGKLALHDLTATSTAAWRFAVATVLLLPFAVPQFDVATLRAARGPLAIMVLCGGVLYPWLFMASLERTSATNTSLIIAIMPVLTCALCPLVGEPISRRHWFAVLLALAGAVVVVSRGEAAGLAGLQDVNDGDLLAFAAAVVWSVFNLASRRAVGRVPGSVINTLVCGIGAVALFGLALPERPLKQLFDASPVGLGGLLFLALVPSVLSGLAYLNAVRVLGVGRSVVFVYCVPFVTAGLAALVLGESLNWNQGAGGALIFSGLLVALDRTPVAD